MKFSRYRGNVIWFLSRRWICNRVNTVSDVYNRNLRVVRRTKSPDFEKKFFCTYEDEPAVQIKFICVIFSTADFRMYYNRRNFIALHSDGSFSELSLLSRIFIAFTSTLGQTYYQNNYRILCLLKINLYQLFYYSTVLLLNLLFFLIIFFSVHFSIYPYFKYLNSWPHYSV